MAVVSFDIEELEELTGKKLKKKVLKNKVTMMGCDFEGFENGEVSYEVFPDRPDMLSAEGFARALRYFLGKDEGLRVYETEESDIEVEKEKSVDSVRPYISAAVISNLDLDESALTSLMQVQEKIHKTLGRERTKVAIGIHDMDRVEAPFTYKGVKPEDVEFTPLQSDEKMNLREIGKKHPKGNYVRIIEGNKKWPIIVDKNNRILSFPPVINGKLTEVTENTKNIFIDVTGTDQKAVDQALNIVVTSLAERGGKIKTVSVDGVDKPDLDPKEMEVDLDYVNSLLGLDLSEKNFTELIRSVGFGYSDGEVKVPAYRTDVMHPIDIVEDVAISYGYENFEAVVPDVPGIGIPRKGEELAGKLREIMIGFGFQEVRSTVLTNKNKQFGRMEMDEEDVAEMENPLTEEYSICRKYILPGLMEVLGQNKHRSYPQKIFEIGDVIVTDGKTETGAKNKRKIAGLLCDERVNYVDMASVVDALMKIFDHGLELRKYDSSMYMDGRAGQIIIDGEPAGFVGEIHPEVLENWELEKPVVAFEIDVEVIGKERNQF